MRLKVSLCMFVDGTKDDKRRAFSRINLIIRDRRGHRVVVVVTRGKLSIKLFSPVRIFRAESPRFFFLFFCHILPRAIVVVSSKMGEKTQKKINESVINGVRREEERKKSVHEYLFSSFRIIETGCFPRCME